MRFPFIRDQEIVVIVILVLNFSLLSTRFPNFSAIYTLWWDARTSKKTCALIGYQRVQNVFSFDSLVDSQKRKKKKEMLVACWIPLMNMNKSFSGIFGENMRSQTRPKWKQNKTKITSRLTDSFGNSMVHENILLSCNISFDPLLRKSSFRFLKCSERNWPMYSLLRLTLAQECKCIKEVLDNRAWIRILPSSVHDIFYTFKEIEFNSSRYIRIRKWTRIILFI